MIPPPYIVLNHSSTLFEATLTKRKFRRIMKKFKRHLNKSIPDAFVIPMKFMCHFMFYNQLYLGIIASEDFGQQISFVQKRSVNAAIAAMSFVRKRSVNAATAAIPFARKRSVNAAIAAIPFARKRSVNAAIAAMSFVRSVVLTQRQQQCLLCEAEQPP